MPTLKKFRPIELVDRYFVQFFMRIPKIYFFSRLDTPNQRTFSAHVPAQLQAAWAELVHRLGVSNFEKKLYFWNPHEKLYKISIGHQNP